MTFDYITAWLEVARPAFEALPANIRALVDRVSAECGELHQLSDCSMPWPTGENAPSGAESLREAFAKVPAEYLALAAHVVYRAGHWHPSNTPRLVPSDGATWKFSHYADQDLRARLGLPERGDNGRDKAAVQYHVHEGVIRVAYSSSDMWSWREIAPATAKGLEAAQVIGRGLRSAIDQFKTRSERDDAAYRFIETIDPRPLVAWPGWEQWGSTDRFQVSEHEMQRREAARRPPVDRVALIAKINAERDATIAKVTRNETIEAAGKVWLIERGLPIDNAIYYSHTGRWCFGWYRPLTADDRSSLLDNLSEFPYDYDLKEGK